MITIKKSESAGEEADNSLYLLEFQALIAVNIVVACKSDNDDAIKVVDDLSAEAWIRLGDIGAVIDFVQIDTRRSSPENADDLSHIQI